MGNTKRRCISRKQLLQEITPENYKEIMLQKALLKKGRQRSFISFITDLFEGKAQDIMRKDDVSWTLAFLFGQLQSKKYQEKRRLFYALLVLCHDMKCHKLVSEKDYLFGLFHIALYQASLVRDPMAWKRNSYNVQKQFSSLLRHCFCEFAVPEFLNEAWMERDMDKERKWFVYIGQGFSVRKLFGFPIQMTKKIAHAFLQAPEHCKIDEALRWAQVIGMGGENRLANAIAASELGRIQFRHEAFWLTVIHFFIRQPMFNLAKLGEIVDFLDHEHMMRPTMCMQGRTLDTLIRQSDEWHNEQTHEKVDDKYWNWESCGISEITFKEGDGENVRHYRFIEMLSSKHLHKESKTMRHCVWSYAAECYKGRIAIFSLRKNDAEGQSTLATIEVSMATKRVVQAKAKCNRKPDGKALRMIQQWAEKEGLGIVHGICD